MLSPLLLNLYNAAVRSLPENRAAQERQIAEELDAAYKAATGRLDKLVNALEKKDEPALKEALQSGIGSGATYTAEQAAFFDAIQEAVFPAPEGVAVSPVNLANLSTLMETLPPVPPEFASGPSDLQALVDATPVGDGETLGREIATLPPQSPPAEVPAPAEAEPIPAPAVTPAEPSRAKKPRGR